MYIDLNGTDDVCCELDGVDCTCELETKHIEQLKKCNFELYNIGWSVDEIEEEIISKVGIPGDPATHFFTTIKTGDNQFIHSFT